MKVNASTKGILSMIEAMVECTKEAVWLCGLVNELGFSEFSEVAL